MNNLKNKNILITAGPTSVPIDKVRVISNIATGKTGILLAEEAEKQGAKVTLLIGPVGERKLNSSIKVKCFYYFDELHNLIKKELKTKKYDIVIHSAAVSDYRLKKIFSDKIKSNIKNFKLDLEPTIKIIDKIKKYDPNVFLVLFKLELGLNKDKMIKIAREAILESKANLAIANTFGEDKYAAYIISHNQFLGPLLKKEDLAKNLIKVIAESL